MTSAEIITALESAKGEEKAQLIYALGSMNDSNANEYYKRLSEKPCRVYHYLCHAVCDAASDYAADILENAVFLMTALSGMGAVPDGMNELMWSALNISAFKSSDRIFEQYERIGQNAKLFSRFYMDMYGLMYSMNMEKFLARRAAEWHKMCGEINFLHILNDMLICGITRNGDAFADRVSALADRYPEAFARAGLFSEFVRDNGKAFDKYGSEKYYDAVFSLFSGIKYSDRDGYMLYSPVWFMGNKNKVYHSRVRIGDDIDIRWLRLLVDISGNENAVHECFGGTGFLRNLSFSYKKMSSMMLDVFSPENEMHRDIMREYFITAAKRCSHDEDIDGLEMCGGYDISEIIFCIADGICRGNNRYYSLYNILNKAKMKRSEKMALLDDLERYIKGNDNSEGSDKRDDFFGEIQLFKDRKKPRRIR